MRRRAPLALPLLLLCAALCAAQEPAEPDSRSPPTAGRPLPLPMDARIDSEGGALRVVATGVAPRLPDGCAFSVALEFFGHVVERAQTQVSAGRFEAVFGPFDRPLAAGPYRVVARFDVSIQDPATQTALVRAFPDPDERRAWGSCRAEAECFYPDAQTYEAEMAHDLEEARSHYEGVITGARRLYDDVTDAFRAAAKSTYRLPDGTFDGNAWRAAMEASYHDLEPTARAARIEALLRDQRFVDEAQHFDVAAWRAWLHRSFWVDIAALQQDHRMFVEQFAFLRHPDADGNMRTALAMLIVTSLTCSQEIYLRNQVATEAEDRDAPAFGVSDLPHFHPFQPEVFIGYVDRVDRELEIGRYRAVSPPGPGESPPR